MTHRRLHYGRFLASQECGLRHKLGKQSGKGPGLFGIGNDGFLVYAFDFRGAGPVVASLGLSSSLWDDVVTDADTFSEWLERRLP